jgi:hypothetical protein
MNKWRQSFTGFFLNPASPTPLAAFRIGISAVLLLQAWLLHDTWLDFSASTGIVQRSIADQIIDPARAHLNGLIEFAAARGVSELTVLTAAGLLYIASLFFLLFGFYTRTAAVMAWWLNWTLNNTGFSGAYGADMYAHIFLFYLIFIPAGASYSLDHYFKRETGESSWLARLGIRALQLHMCISYLASGIEKATGEQWWNGEVIWRALNLPTYSSYDFHWMAQFPLIPMLLGWGTLVIEIFYCVAIWPRQTRWLWVLAVCLLHGGIVVFLRLPIFGLLMCVPTFTLFGLTAEAPR